jgi:hypothetical protein
MSRGHDRSIRERFGLTSQMAVRAIAKAVECFHRDKSKCPVFKSRSAICYDQRVLSFKGLTEVSLWAMTGRLRIPFVRGTYQKERQGRIKGQAALAGVPIEKVDPRDTSRTCHECGFIAKSNRKSQGEFSRGSCGHRANADVNAALNIRALAQSKRAMGLASHRVLVQRKWEKQRRSLS